MDLLRSDFGIFLLVYVPRSSDMPTERSLLRSGTEVMITPANLKDQIEPEIFNFLPPVNLLQMGKSSQINSNEFCLLKLPTF